MTHDFHFAENHDQDNEQVPKHTKGHNKNREYVPDCNESDIKNLKAWNDATDHGSEMQNTRLCIIKINSICKQITQKKIQ
jgi:hypothetical protein